MFKRILVPLDESETVEKVLSILTEEAELHKAEVVLIKVIAHLRPTLRALPTMVEEAVGQLDDYAQYYLDDIAEDLREKGLTVTTKIDRGQPAVRILEYAKSSHCDLIIIGSHGWTHSIRWRFGSISNYIVRAKTNIPILFVPTG